MLTNRQLFLELLGQTSGSPLLLEIKEAEGIYMYGPSGEKYIDLISGVSVSNTGHCHPHVIEAVKKQIEFHMHLMVYGELIQNPQVRYGEKLISLLPETLNNCYFVNSGSEAVEGALKLAKRYTGRSRIISFTNSYHGSTHGSLSVTGNEHLKRAFRPLLPGVHHIPFNNISSLSIIDEKTACVIAEPVQAEAGVIYPENDFLLQLRNRCTKTGTLLIFDEVQTAFGRLGKMFAFEKFGVVPDILVLAKALGGGMPLGAFITSKEIMSSLTHNPPLGHITTFGGHPVCCAAGLASLEVIINEKLIEQVQEKSALFREYLNHEAVKEIRGDGLLLAVETGDSEMTGYIISHAPEYGLILDYFLFSPTAFRIAPPLVITKEEIKEACEKLLALIETAYKNTSGCKR
ncbi:MAG TPA: aspartate aminotransferase family protein [Bacteroidales bacterium]|nr:aspartate aminotransferase family protein [Bacteroidales bacterium]HOK74481.1 aspartate aminotransferase family protein [Bacteroidales bacterium]HOM40525.1 aspartate aminotransferase family protein [Bacteroidales bacterium]HPP92904.1 aspartate aminotransferase family protein [Bacteroidales bacterium]HRR16933.1 aspartate aminotransferase family protein [Bacteroidales bacterium]